MTQTQFEQPANWLKALAHPLRIRILLLLLQQPGQSVSAIQHQLNADQSALSQYLIQLKHQAILTSQRKVRQVHYSVADPALIKSVLQRLGLTVRQENGSADDVVEFNINRMLNHF